MSEPAKRATPWTDADERRYHRGLAKLCLRAGKGNLAQSHMLAAHDCPKGCGCKGCCETRRDAAVTAARRERAAA